MKRFSKFLYTTAICFLVIAPSAHSAEKAGSVEVIQGLNETLLDVMKRAKNLGYHGRYKTLEPVLSKAFDFPFMIQYAVGQPWKEISEDQKKELISAFSNFTIATYADRFNGYSGEQFTIVGSRNAPRNTKLVNTKLIMKKGKAIKLNYLMRDNGQGWQIMDIFLKGSISELATKRSDYNSTIKNEGFHSLISKIKEKTAIIQAQSSRP
jgi:phospholipid transport system substrate-binding protein